MPTDIDIYCNYLDRVRYHVGIADTVFARKIETGHPDLNTELNVPAFPKGARRDRFRVSRGKHGEIFRRAADSRQDKETLTGRLQRSASSWEPRSSSCLNDDGLRIVTWKIVRRDWI